MLERRGRAPEPAVVGDVHHQPRPAQGLPAHEPRVDDLVADARRPLAEVAPEGVLAPRGEVALAQVDVVQHREEVVPGELFGEGDELALAVAERFPLLREEDRGVVEVELPRPLAERVGVEEPGDDVGPGLPRVPEELPVLRDVARLPGRAGVAHQARDRGLGQDDQVGGGVDGAQHPERAAHPFGEVLPLPLLVLRDVRLQHRDAPGLRNLVVRGERSRPERQQAGREEKDREAAPPRAPLERGERDEVRRDDQRRKPVDADPRGRLDHRERDAERVAQVLPRERHLALRAERLDARPDEREQPCPPDGVQPEEEPARGHLERREEAEQEDEPADHARGRPDRDDVVDPEVHRRAAEDRARERDRQGVARLEAAQGPKPGDQQDEREPAERQRRIGAREQQGAEAVQPEELQEPPVPPTAPEMPRDAEERRGDGGHQKEHQQREGDPAQRLEIAAERGERNVAGQREQQREKERTAFEEAARGRGHQRDRLSEGVDQPSSPSSSGPSSVLNG